MKKVNFRTTISLEVVDKEKLTELAKQQNRSLNNLIVTILKDYIERYLPPPKMHK